MTEAVCYCSFPVGIFIAAVTLGMIGLAAMGWIIIWLFWR